MLPQCLLRSLFQYFLVQNKLGNTGPNLEAWLLCNANRNDLAAEWNQHGCVFSFIRFLWGDQADWLLLICTSDNAAALWVTRKHQPVLEVMQSCAAAVGLLGNSLQWGFECISPTARCDGCTSMGNGNCWTARQCQYHSWLSEGKHLWLEGGWLPGGLVPTCHVG